MLDLLENFYVARARLNIGHARGQALGKVWGSFQFLYIFDI
jgi:hypothetical protein